FGGPVGTAPPGLATTKKWAVSKAWVEPQGAGAFSRTEWDAFVLADREITSRGEKAHALSLRLREEDVATTGGGPEPRKADREIDKDLLEGLRFVAAREPLTASDARAIATGLWKENRYGEALAFLEGSSATRGDGAASPDD